MMVVALSQNMKEREKERRKKAIKNSNSRHAKAKALNHKLKGCHIDTHE
jgi:hypothetical protein